MLRYGALACIAVALQVAPALADPELLSDRDLDAVSARGFSFPGLNFDASPLFTNVIPVAPVLNSNDTEVRNNVFGVANTTVINTAVNTCVFVHECESSGAEIESHPVTANTFSIQNQIKALAQPTVSVPTITNSTIGDTAGLQPLSSQPPAAQTGPEIRHGSHGIVRTPPPLPASSWGSWGIK